MRKDEGTNENTGRSPCRKLTSPQASLPWHCLYFLPLPQGQGSLRPTLWKDEATMRREINALAAGADWVFPGLAEGELLTGHKTPEAIAQFYRSQGARLVVVKLGEAGAYFDDEEAGTGYVEGCPVDKVVDTVGAGDAFAVGVISGLLDGRTVPEAVKRGCWIGALQVQVLGDSEGLPTRAALMAAGY